MGRFTNQEEMTRMVIDVVGGGERWLCFYESERVMTTSYNQVRHLIDNKSEARWKNCERHLNSLIAMFGASRTNAKTDE